MSTILQISPQMSQESLFFDHPDQVRCTLRAEISLFWALNIQPPQMTLGDKIIFSFPFNIFIDFRKGDIETLVPPVHP